MTKKTKTLTLSDRLEIEQAYLIGKNIAEIATSIDSCPSTIYRELHRGYAGRPDINGRPAYSAKIAQEVNARNIKRRGCRRRTLDDKKH